MCMHLQSLSMYLLFAAAMAVILLTDDAPFLTPATVTLDTGPATARSLAPASRVSASRGRLAQGRAANVTLATLE